MAPSFRYLIGGAEEEVVPGSPLWESPLPMDRHHFQDGGKSVPAPIDFTHGDYFTAARRFLEEDGYSLLSKALTPEPIQDISDIEICLMKHGECYHPARIAVVGNGRRRFFVLNVAVSETGQGIMDTEVLALARLGAVPGPSYIPGIYGRGGVSADSGRVVRMFLGEWFDGYHEFHLSSRDGGGLCVWGKNDHSFHLSREAAYLVYHQAAKILTRYYNPGSTRHISHWHHAAGDFVVRFKENRVDVRLITVRQYGPMLRMEEKNGSPVNRREQALAALLLFLIGLSVRMRLDRLDGIGDVAWADDTAVVATWTGFLEGLSENCFPAPFLTDPVEQFKEYLAACSPGDLLDLSETLAPALTVGPAEKTVIKTQLASHMETLLDTIRNIGFS